MKNLAYIICDGNLSNLKIGKKEISFVVTVKHYPNLNDENLIEAEKIETSQIVCHIPKNNPIAENVIKHKKQITGAKVTVMGNLRMVGKKPIVLVTTLRFESSKLVNQ